MHFKWGFKLFQLRLSTEAVEKMKVSVHIKFSKITGSSLTHHTNYHSLIMNYVVIVINLLCRNNIRSKNHSRKIY